MNEHNDYTRALCLIYGHRWNLQQSACTRCEYQIAMPEQAPR